VPALRDLPSCCGQFNARPAAGCGAFGCSDDPQYSHSRCSAQARFSVSWSAESSRMFRELLRLIGGPQKDGARDMSGSGRWRDVMRS
jgi:hypothetical protein